MKEALLHYIWKYRLYDSSRLVTTDGEAVQVIHPGSHNTDAGADFSQAKIKIGAVLLVGNVELHLRQRDWYAHEHDTDSAYNNTILHVVYELDDNPTLLANGHQLSTLSLMGKINEALLQQYQRLATSQNQIPCESLLPTLPIDFSWPYYLERLVIERLQTKVAVIETLLLGSNNDWNQVAFEMIATYFGASVNKEPFGLLARHLPLQLIHKHRDSPLQIEALVFGVAGMLEGHFDDDYPNSLKREFQYLKRLHSLTSIAPESWKYFRIRPVNFPTIKLAQLASLLTQQPFLFASMLECSTIEQLRALFHVTIDPYWLTHYQWDKPVAKVNTQLGDMLVEIVLINAVVPLLFSYARYKGDESIGSHALELLGALPAEKNHITKRWDALRIKAYNASESQALIQLKREYCEAFRCLDCEVGHRLLGAATARQ